MARDGSGWLGMGGMARDGSGSCRVGRGSRVAGKRSTAHCHILRTTEPRFITTVVMGGSQVSISYGSVTVALRLTFLAVLCTAARSSYNIAISNRRVLSLPF